jgi:tellurite methyltransferase
MKLKITALELLMNKNQVKEKNDHFWDEFYSGDFAPHEPTPFFHWLENYLDKSKRKIVELGCGNGRDSFGFAGAGHSAISIDGSLSAIDYCNKIKNNLPNENIKSNIEFKELNLKDIANLQSKLNFQKFNPNLIYSRFLLHAVTQDIQDEIIKFSYKILSPGGYMAHEFRTDKDPLMLKGEVISNNERVTDHYRRFINANEIVNTIQNIGFEIVYFCESSGLAVYKNDDPVVARIIARKRN